MPRFTIAALCFLLLPARVVIADSPQTPIPWMVTSSRGAFLFKMVPPKIHFGGADYKQVRDPFGIAYAVTEDGDLVEQWRADGWYAFKGYLHDDGNHFVRMGPWASDQKNLTDLAIAFYAKDRLVKQYQVKDLIEDPQKLEHSVSHYEWQPRRQSQPDGFREDLFCLVTIEKTVLSFDIKTGEIVDRDTDKDARSSFELFEEDREADRVKGVELLKQSPFRSTWEKEFTISEIEAARGKGSGVEFEEPEWRATFTPKVGLAQPCEVNANFPIGSDQKIQVLVTPTEIRQALEKGLAHPFIRPRFGPGRATSIRMRITGNRLHWNTPNLKESIIALTGKPVGHEDLRHWADLTVVGPFPKVLSDSTDPIFGGGADSPPQGPDGKEPGISFYLNIRTGEIIYQYMSKKTWTSVLVDAQGKVVVER